MTVKLSQNLVIVVEVGLEHDGNVSSILLRLLQRNFSLFNESEYRNVIFDSLRKEKHIELILDKPVVFDFEHMADALGIKYHDHMIIVGISAFEFTSQSTYKEKDGVYRFCYSTSNKDGQRFDAAILMLEEHEDKSPRREAIVNNLEQRVQLMKPQHVRASFPTLTVVSNDINMEHIHKQLIEIIYKN